MPAYDLTTGNMTINQINQRVPGIGERILFNALDDYAGQVSGTGITATNDTTTVYEGKASLKLVIDVTGNRNAQISVPDLDKDWTAFNTLLLHLQANDATTLTFRVRSSASDYNDYEFTPTSGAAFYDIWVNLSSPTSTTGTPNMDAVNVIQLRGLVASKTYYVDKPSLLGKDDVLQSIYKKCGDPTSTSLPVGKSTYDVQGTTYTGVAGARTTQYHHLSTVESYIQSGSYGVSSIESNVERHGVRIESSVESASYGVSSIQSNVQRHGVQMESSLESGSYGVSSVQSNVQRHGIQAESSLESASYGVSSIQSNVQAHGVQIESTLESGSYGNSSVQSNVQRHAVQVESSLESGSYGQSSIESNVERHGVRIESTVESGTYGNSQLLSAIQDTGSYGTSAIQSNVERHGVRIESSVESGSYGVSSIESNVQRQAVQIESSLESGSYGVSSVQSNVQRQAVQIESSLESGTYGNSQITSYLSSGSYGVSSIESNVQRHSVQIESSLESGSYGMSSVQSNVQRHGVQVESSLESGTYGASQIYSACVDTRGTSQVLSEIDQCLNTSGSYSLSSIQSNVQRQAVQIESTIESRNYGVSSIESNVERHGVRVESSVESGTYGNSVINANVDTESSNVISAITATKYAYQRSSFYSDPGAGNTIPVPKNTWTTLRTYIPNDNCIWELRRLTIGIDSFVGSEVTDAVYRVDIQGAEATGQGYPYSTSGETFTDATEAILVDDGLCLHKGCSAIVKMWQNTANGISAVVSSLKVKAFYQQSGA